MPSWEEAHAAAISAFSSVVTDVSNIYQRVLFQGSGIYPAQDRAREYWEMDYQPTPDDWKEYGEYSAEWERENPDPRLTGEDLDAPEP
jgi:hypothetical protein